MKIEDNPNKPKGMSYAIKQDETVESFLMRIMNGKSKTALKQLLQKDAISVNGRALHRLDEILPAGTSVFVGNKPAPYFPMPGLRIIYEDRWLIVVKKESGLLTVGNESENTQTAQVYLNAYMRFRKEGDYIFIVHRIDRDTSGILLFAKNEMTQFRLRSTWNESVLSRRYIAIVEGCPNKKEGTIDTWLDENEKTMTMFVCRPGQGKQAITHYKVIKTNDQFSMLELELETGRKNQIRLHMSHIGHPVAGDGKYGAKSDPCKRLCLHAQQIEFIHPATGETMEFTSEIPSEFLKVFDNRKSNLQPKSDVEKHKNKKKKFIVNKK